MISLTRSSRWLPAIELPTEAVRIWIEERGVWWATSGTAHALVLPILMLLAGAYYTAPQAAAVVPRFEAAHIDTSVPEIDRVEMYDSRLETEFAPPEDESIGKAPPLADQEAWTTAPRDLNVGGAGEASDGMPTWS